MTDIKWTNDKIRLGDLQPWENNPRYSTEKQAERITDSHRVFGQSQPIEIDLENNVLNGHQRLSAWMAEYGPGFEVDVRRASKVFDEVEKQAYTVTIHEGATGSWNVSELANWSWDTEEWAAFGIDDDFTTQMHNTAFEFEALRGSENGKEPPPDTAPLADRADELQEKWQVKPGDIWQMNAHRLICGDCREPEIWERLLGGQKVNGAFTSPPYAEQRKKQYGGVPADEYVEWWEAVQENVRASLAADGSFFVNIKPHCEGGQRVLYVFDLVLAMVRRWGWLLVDELSWVSGGYPGKHDPRFKNGFEPIYHFGNAEIKFRKDNVIEEMTQANKRKTKKNKSAYGDRGRYYSPTGSKTNLNQSTFDDNYRYPSNVLFIPADRGFLRDDTIIDIHSATFPIKLSTFFIKAYSDPNDIWLDPFCGSGTTIIAAENEGRIGYGIEKLEKYCAVTIQRWVDHTNQQPQLLNT